MYVHMYNCNDRSYLLNHHYKKNVPLASQTRWSKLSPQWWHKCIYNNQEVIFLRRWTEMFYGTRGESSEGESPGTLGSTNSTPTSVDFPEVKKKVGDTCMIN